MTVDVASPPERAYLLGLDGPGAAFDVEDSLDELEALVRAAGASVVGRSAQRRRSPDPNLWVGKGKLAEVSEAIKRAGADLLVCDDELLPRQQQNLEKACDVRVIDRSAVILDIFAQHARSREGSVQVELAQLQYRLPRLRGTGRELSRLGGGINTRGPGEMKLETDRRVIERRIQDLRAKLADIAAQRERSRRSRSRDGLFLAALVGYTNAGKSTLLNAIAASDVLVADQPFATLDPTTRRATLPNGTLILVSDTVGFVSKLPPTLVAAFRATLEELTSADLLLHVVDAAHANLHERIGVVQATLRSLELDDRETLLVLNQVDRLVGPEGAAVREALMGEFPDAVVVSGRTGEGLEQLRDRLARHAAARWRTIALTIAHADGGVLQRIRERGALRRAEYGEAGIAIEAEVPSDLASELRARAVG